MKTGDKTSNNVVLNDPVSEGTYKLPWAIYIILLMFGACLPGVEVGGASTIQSVNSFLVNSGFVSFPHSTTLTLS